MRFQIQPCPTKTGLWNDCAQGCQHWVELICGMGKTKHRTHSRSRDHKWGDEQSPKRERAFAGRWLESD